MACMEHECTNPKCNWSSMSNSRGPVACPKCGERVTSHFDEDIDRDDEEYDDDEPEHDDEE